VKHRPFDDGWRSTAPLLAFEEPIYTAHDVVSLKVAKMSAWVRADFKALNAVSFESVHCHFTFFFVQLTKSTLNLTHLCINFR